jgi:ribosomal protein L12E/L44/L45/RPP1/RPP2
MRDRGETLREIARMAGISEKAVRELIREAESTEPAAAAAPAPAETATAAVSTAVADTAGSNEVSAHTAHADGRSWEPVSARA